MLIIVVVVIVVFLFLYKGLIKSMDVGLYFILFGLVVGYFTIVWSLGVVRLGDKFCKGLKDLDLVFLCMDVIWIFSIGFMVNVIGFGVIIVGL